eukprot:6191851-Pleurochrysis_carterae.AAC.4
MFKRISRGVSLGEVPVRTMPIQRPAVQRVTLVYACSAPFSEQLYSAAPAGVLSAELSESRERSRR